MLRAKPLFLSAFLFCFVSLAIAETAQLSVNPDSLFFRQNGSKDPEALTVAVAAKGGTLGAFTATAATTSGGSWLSVSPAGGSGAGTLSISVKTTGLAKG